MSSCYSSQARVPECHLTDYKLDLNPEFKKKVDANILYLKHDYSSQSYITSYCKNQQPKNLGSSSST